MIDLLELKSCFLEGEWTAMTTCSMFATLHPRVTLPMSSCHFVISSCDFPEVWEIPTACWTRNQTCAIGGDLVGSKDFVAFFVTLSFSVSLGFFRCSCRSLGWFFGQAAFSSLGSLCLLQISETRVACAPAHLRSRGCAKEIILTIFEHWKSMGTPEEFLRKLPDAPRDDQAQNTQKLRVLKGSPFFGVKITGSFFKSNNIKMNQWIK